MVVAGITSSVMKNSCDTGPGQELKQFWNQRFGAAEYVYGKEPNAFFKSVIDNMTPGRIFIPGAGEGRDAVYAAAKGWDVYCADTSDAGRDKAMKLAAEKKVGIRYEIMDINDAVYPDAYFDAVASVFFHLPEKTRLRFYQGARKWLKPGGLFMMEAFTPKQLQYRSGGPKDADMLVDTEQLTKELVGFDTILLKESEVLLDEGTHHQGMGSVLDFTGRKK